MTGKTLLDIAYKGIMSYHHGGGAYMAVEKGCLVSATDHRLVVCPKERLTDGEIEQTLADLDAIQIPCYPLPGGAGFEFILRSVRRPQ